MEKITITCTNNGKTKEAEVLKAAAEAEAAKVAAEATNKGLT